MNIMHIKLNTKLNEAIVKYRLSYSRQIKHYISLYIINYSTLRKSSIRGSKLKLKTSNSKHRY